MTGFDITDTLAPNSDQLDGIELASGPRTFVIESVSKGSLEQPVNVHFVDFPRPWRPSKGMRRVVAMCWGADASTWAGRSVRLFFDPTVTFGKDTPGGTRIEALSHIDGVKKVPLLISRGKSAIYTVKPLADAPTPKQPTSRLPELVATLRTLGVTDKAECLAVVSQIADRKLTSANDLSADELATALDTLAAFNGDGQRVRDAFDLPAGES